MSAYTTDFAAMGLPNQGPCWEQPARHAIPAPAPLTSEEKNRIWCRENAREKRAKAEAAGLTSRGGLIRLGGGNETR